MEHRILKKCFNGGIIKEKKKCFDGGLGNNYGG